MTVKRIGDAQEILDLFPAGTGDENIQYSAWSSPRAFSKHVAGMDQNKAWHPSAWDNDRSFRGTNTMQEALDLAAVGWKEGITKADKLREKILTLHPIGLKMVRYGIVGAVPCVPRAVAGNPLNMITKDRAAIKKRPVITLLSNMSVPYYVDADALSNRAAVIAALIDHIEGSGFACDVIAFGRSEGNGVNAQTMVLVKNSSQPVDIAKLAYGLGHASMFRRLVFADWGFYPFTEKLGRGLGHIVGDFDTAGMADKGVYLLPKIQGSMFDTEEASEKEGLKFLVHSLKTQGCLAFSKFTPEELKEIEEEKTKKKLNLLDF